MAGSDELGPGVYFVKAKEIRPTDVLDEGLRVHSVTYEPNRVTVEAGHDEVVEEDLGDDVTIRNETTGAEFPARKVTLHRIEWTDLREIAFRSDEKVRIARGVPPGVGSGFLGSPWRSGPDEGLSRLRPSSPEDELLQ